VMMPGIEPESMRYASLTFLHGQVLLAQRKFAPAWAQLEPTAALLQRLVGEGHDVTVNANLLAAMALAGLGRFDEAEQRLGAAARHAAEPAVAAITRVRLANAQARLDRLRGRHEAAIPRLQALLREPAEPAELVRRLRRERARGRIELGLNLLALRQREPAAAAFETALADLSQLEVERTPWRADAESGLARARTP